MPRGPPLVVNGGVRSTPETRVLAKPERYVLWRDRRLFHLRRSAASDEPRCCRSITKVYFAAVSRACGARRKAGQELDDESGRHASGYYMSLAPLAPMGKSCRTSGASWLRGFVPGLDRRRQREVENLMLPARESRSEPSPKAIIGSGGESGGESNYDPARIWFGAPQRRPGGDSARATTCRW